MILLSGVQWTRCLFLLLLVFASLPMSLQAGQRAEPQTVVDYYLALPKKYAYGVDRKHREKLLAADGGRIIAKDIPNGYLAISGDAGDPGITLALFKRADGHYLIGVNLYNELSEDFYFLDYAGGKWTDVTKTMIPGFSKQLRYELPQHGTTIQVNDVGGRYVCRLIWDKTKFTRR
jgi:hypothetical protein